jgi:hypothetical protein
VAGSLIKRSRLRGPGGAPPPHHVGGGSIPSPATTCNFHRCFLCCRLCTRPTPIFHSAEWTVNTSNKHILHTGNSKSPE